MVQIMDSKGKMMERSQVGFAVFEDVGERTEEDGVKKEERMRGGVGS